jgi:H+-transporting ATPase
VAHESNTSVPATIRADLSISDLGRSASVQRARCAARGRRANRRSLGTQRPRRSSEPHRQRILTYALNSVTKKTVQVLFLAVGLVMTGQAILTPMLMVIIILTGDLLGMSLTTDNVRRSPTPNVWRIGVLTMVGVFIGIAELVFCTSVLAVAKFGMGFGIEALRTVAFVVIVFGNQAITYTNRERQRMGSCRPSQWLVGSSVADLLIASMLAVSGIAMAPLPISVVGGILVAAVVFAFIVDFAKVPVFHRLRIA